MKYTTHVEIALPRNRVIELFDNPDNYSSWQESLVGMELLEGAAGQEGARTSLEHKMGSREITMIETVTHRGLPERFTATYEAKGVWNEADNHFSELDGDRTMWKMDTEFRCSGLMWLMTNLMPGMFKKQTQATMEAFKSFAENHDASAPEAAAVEDPVSEPSSSDEPDAAE